MLEFSTLTLRFHNRKISGSSECNRFTGRYEITGEEITIKVLERTTDECMQPGIIEQDDAFIDNLEAAARFSFSENELKLYSEEGQELLDLSLMTK
jgi:heat shock protein HslJ